MTKHKDAPCQCDICKHGNRFYEIIAMLPEDAKQWMSRHYDTFLSISEDLSYRCAIMDGTWPSAVEQLTRALAEAKRLRADEAGFK